MTGWGTHSLDQVPCALGADHTGPVEMWLEERGYDENSGWVSKASGWAAPGRWRCPPWTLTRIPFHRMFSSGMWISTELWATLCRTYCPGGKVSHISPTRKRGNPALAGLNP